MLNNFLFNILVAAKSAKTHGPDVDVLFAGKSLSNGYGPTPFVDMTQSFGPERTNINSVITSIDLTGKIIPTGANGANNSFQSLLSKAKSFEDDIFRKCLFGKFQITHSGNTIYELENVKVKQVQFNKTQNNWTKYIDYSVSLEAHNAVSGNPDNIESKTDSWTIDTVEDHSYTLLSTQLNNTEVGFSDTNLSLTSIPQFRISRTLSAKGLPVPLSGSLTGCSAYSQVDNLNHMRFLHAKNWVNKESNYLFNSHSGTIALISGNVFNHTRTITADIYNGTYQVTDSWLGMPTGTPYVETFTLECSSADNKTRTVKIAGNIIGLSTPIANETDNTHNVFISGNNNIKLNLTQANNGITNKYQNAINGLNLARSQAYKRACLGSQNHPDRSRRINSIELDPHNPSNPIFMNEQPLSIKPLSSQETHDPLKGIISYNYEYNNRYQVLSMPGILTENIRITNDAPTDNISENDILVDSSTTRYITSLGRTNPRKTLNIDILVNLPDTVDAMIRTNNACPLYIYGEIYSAILNLVNGNAPFNSNSRSQGVTYIQNDRESWNPTEGRFTKSISWAYQHCTINQPYLDH